MEWRDEAIVLGARRHGESSVIAELMTREHGRHLGLVRGGRSRSMQPIIQAGNKRLRGRETRSAEAEQCYILALESRNRDHRIITEITEV